jgi:hypothetical protein
MSGGPVDGQFTITAERSLPHRFTRYELLRIISVKQNMDHLEKTGGENTQK